MNDMIVHLQRELHQVADRVGILRNGDSERILDRAHRRQGVRAGAHAADPFGERPGIARIAILQDDFDAAPHRACGYGVPGDVICVDVDLDPHVTFDASDRIDNNALAGIVELESVGCLEAHRYFP